MNILDKAHKAIEASGTGRHTIYMDFKNDRGQRVYVVDCYFNEEEGTIALTDTDLCICGIHIQAN